MEMEQVNWKCSLQLSKNNSSPELAIYRVYRLFLIKCSSCFIIREETQLCIPSLGQACWGVFKKVDVVRSRPLDCIVGLFRHGCFCDFHMHYNEVFYLRILILKYYMGRVYCL